MGKLTISMAIFNSYVKLPKGNGIFTTVFNWWTGDSDFAGPEKP